MENVQKRPDPAEQSQDDGPPTIDVAELFGQAREVRLFYRNQYYYLRITKADKLILTK